MSCCIDSSDRVVTGRDDNKIKYYSSSGNERYEINNGDTKDCRDLHFASDGQRYVGACEKKGIIVTNSSENTH